VTEPLVDIREVSFGYGGRRVLDGVSTTIRPGEVLGLVGPNGAGKSTLVRALLGFNRPDSGSIFIEGRNIAAIPGRQRAKLMAYVPQSSTMGFPITVFESILLGRTPHMGARVTERDTAIVEDLLARLKLESFADRLMSELSGGERQRVMLARALAQEARILVLDEPTSALDIGNQLFTLRVVGEIARERGVAALIAIHDLSLAARFAERLILLHGGKVRAHGGWEDTLTSEAIHEVYGVKAHVGMVEGAPIFVPYEN